MKVYLLIASLFLANNIFTADILRIFAGPALYPLLDKMDKKRIDEHNKQAQEIDKKEKAQFEDSFETVIVDKEVIEKFKIVLQFLKDPKKFELMGIKAPKGILLYGPPGTGKTSLGRALAKEANCHFEYVAGSEIDDMWVASGSKKLKAIFDNAKAKAPTIIFIDEVDTIAKKRQAIETRFHTETIQQFLVELDGFKKSNKPVVVIASTNNRSQLDPAILRSGRFDWHIKIGNPNQENIAKIFTRYTKKIKLAPDMTQEAINELCKNMQGLSGADIENIVNQASINALLNKKQSIDLQEFKKAISDLKKQND